MKQYEESGQIMIMANSYEQYSILDHRNKPDNVKEQIEISYHKLATNEGLAILQNSIRADPPKFQFSRFPQLNEYLDPPTWSLEICGPSLSGKTQLLKDLAITMCKTTKILYVCCLKPKFNANSFKVVEAHTLSQLFMLLSVITENANYGICFSSNKDYKLIIFDDINLLFHLNEERFYETGQDELKLFLHILKLKEVQIVITSPTRRWDPRSQYIKKQPIRCVMRSPWNNLFEGTLRITKFFIKYKKDGKGRFLQSSYFQYTNYPDCIRKKKLMIE